MRNGTKRRKNVKWHLKLPRIFWYISITIKLKSLLSTKNEWCICDWFEMNGKSAQNENSYGQKYIFYVFIKRMMRWQTNEISTEKCIENLVLR